MIKTRSVIKIILDTEEINLCTKYAENCTLGGKSKIANHKYRGFEDQFVGQLGTAAGHKYWFGHLNHYIESRELADKDPWKGDKGEDIIGCNIDFKTSLMRSSNKFYDYRLPVRPGEMHESWVYVSILIHKIEVPQPVYLIGWATSDMFPPVETEGIFSGAHVIRNSDLLPLLPIRWREVDETTDGGTQT